MRRIALGQFYNVDSPLHRLDPRVKMVLVLAFMVSVFFASVPWGMLAVVAMLVLMVVTSRVPLPLVTRALKPLGVFVALTFLGNLLVVRTGDVVVSILGLAITTDGLASSLVLGFRVFALMLAGVVFTLSTSPVAITDAADSLLSPLARLGVPVHDFATMLTIAIRFVPILSGEMHGIMKAQAARGAALDEGPLTERARRLISMIVPLFASSLRHAEELAFAMDARCYEGGEGRTHYHVLKVGRADLVAVIVFVVYLGFLVACAVVG